MKKNLCKIGLRRRLAGGVVALGSSTLAGFGIPLDNLNYGAAAIDAATGYHYLMYSVENIRDRFAPNTFNVNASDHFVVVREVSGQWQFDTNYAYVNFTPVVSDLLIAKLNSTSNTVTQDYEGAKGVIEGVRYGYAAGDLQIDPETWGNPAFAAGEWQLTGTYLELWEPDWWAERGLLKGAGEEDPYSLANIGQLKNMATQAHAEMEGELPGGAGFVLGDYFSPPPGGTPGAEWYLAQKVAANLGQLKALALPFYDRVNDLAPSWVAGQLNTSYNGTWTHSVPWNPDTAIIENYNVATLGHLKFVFALRFSDSSDGDHIPDFYEHMAYGDTTSVNDSTALPGRRRREPGMKATWMETG